MSAQDQIRETINKNDVVLFMKGTKMMPQCGFSSRVAGVLNFMGVEFADVNVLADQEIRQGIACVKHQNMSGSDIGDDHKEYFAGEAALKAAGKDNTMNQF